MKRSVRFLDLIQTAAIVLGIGIGIVELSQFRAERSRQAAIELARSFQTPGLMEGLMVAYRMPDGATAKEVVEYYGGNEALLNETGQVFETVGVLVYRGELDLRLVDDLLGGATMMFWEKTRAYWEEGRRTFDRPAIAEWFQWLAERLAELPTGQEAPAYEAFREWRPGN
jgi:hypothetical protein